MTQNRPKRVTQKGTLAVREQWRGLRPGRKELRQGMARMVREGARVSVERGAR